MAFVAADWSIDRQTRNIRYIGNGHTGAAPSYATVIQFHRALQDFADDAGYSGNDELDITDPTPSERSTDNIVTLINGWNIDDTASEHIYDGSVIQDGGNVIYDGIKILAPIGTAVQFLQNGAIAPGGSHTGSNNAATLTDSTKSWTTNQWVGHRIRNVTDGSFAVITANSANTVTGTLGGGTDNDWDTNDKYVIASSDWWNYSEGGTHTGSNNAATLTDSTKSWTTNQWVGYRIRNTTDGSFTTITANTATTITGVLQGGTDNDWDASDTYVIVDGLNSDSANGVSHNFMLKVRTAAADIDGRRLVATTREWGRTFLEFKVNGTTRGINVVALAAASDLNNTTSATTVAGYTTITNTTSGYNGIDVNNDTTDEYYYSEWNRDTYTINQFYERMKYLTRDNSLSSLYGLNGEVFRGITHEVALSGGSPSGTFSAFEQVSWGSGATAGTGQMLAIDNTTASSATKMWIQLLTGVAPSSTVAITGATSGAVSRNNSGTPTERTVSAPFCGVSTGSAIIGAYGFGVEAADLSENDKVFDLTNTQYSPPNFVTFTVSGLVSSPNDRVLVGPKGFRFAYDTEASGPFQVGETITFTSPSGTAVLAELYDNGTTGFMYIGEMVTGSTPTDNSGMTGGTSNATASVNGTVSADINLRQMTLNGALTTNNALTAVVNGTIPADTPNTGSPAGTIRIERADGQYTRHRYTSWTGSTFTLHTDDDDFASNNAANGANVFISYIDDAVTSGTTKSFTSVYSADRNLFIRVRSGSDPDPTKLIKTFETTGTLGSSDSSITTIRTSDA